MALNVTRDSCVELGRKQPFVAPKCGGAPNQVAKKCAAGGKDLAASIPKAVD